MFKIFFGKHRCNKDIWNAQSPKILIPIQIINYKIDQQNQSVKYLASSNNLFEQLTINLPGLSQQEVQTITQQINIAGEGKEDQVKISFTLNQAKIYYVCLKFLKQENQIQIDQKSIAIEANYQALENVLCGDPNCRSFQRQQNRALINSEIQQLNLELQKQLEQEKQKRQID